MKSENKIVDISMLSETEQDLVIALVKKCCENVKYKEKVKPKPKVWKPKCGDEYWFINGDRARTDGWIDGISVDNRRLALGNVFKTKEDAEFAIEKQKVKIELQRYADKHNNPEEENWDSENKHHFIYYASTSKKICTAYNTCYIFEGVIYFTSKEIAENAIKTVGEKRILKYLFGVDCEVNS